MSAGFVDFFSDQRVKFLWSVIEAKIKSLNERTI